MRLGVGAALVDGSLVPGDVEVADGRIAGVGLSSANGSGVAAPGFVDLQVNGFAGVDFFSADTSGYRKSGEARFTRREGPHRVEDVRHRLGAARKGSARFRRSRVRVPT